MKLIRPAQRPGTWVNRRMDVCDGWRARHGLHYDGSARQFVRSDFERFDLIVAMDLENRSDLLRLARTPGEEVKIHLLREFDPSGGARAAVPDPYYSGIDGFEETFEIVRSLLPKLVGCPGNGFAAVNQMNTPVPTPVEDWLLLHGFGAVQSIIPVGGGCISNGARLKTASGGSFFLKTNGTAPENMFECEAEGLVALRVAGGPRLPEPHVWGKGFLLMEDLHPALRGANYWPDFGRRLAVLHNQVNDEFGFPRDNFIGSTHQPNTWMTDGFEFFAEQRLLFKTRLADAGGLLQSREVRQVESLAARLPELVPVQPASLIHGDLWSGNAITDRNGAPALIDPAAHYGWAEAELAMTALFGGFPDGFYAAYIEERPLVGGWQQRLPVYNLYHLLNHLNLFGGSYQMEVLRILHRYAGS